jgi:hypothetical protein
MKCSHPMCGRAIGLVSHRRWFGKGLYCSRRCRDNYTAARPSPMPLSADAKLFAWLLAPARTPASRSLVAANVRMRTRRISF